MNSGEIRSIFLDFFQKKAGHQIVPSAPLVNKSDPTLMFTNAGMNQFKDYFLGNQVPKVRRVADTQKCLRVSGKHNDLEDVGKDGTHHTMFEMLGNWSFGDYFKKEAIQWAWELLTSAYGLDPERMYVTVFEGDKEQGLEPDAEAANYWLELVPSSRILYANKKDNFWEMGDSGPCGPCSEIHVDMRSDAERQVVDGATLVNKDHPLVVEIWNLVFIQFNRKANGTLEALPEKHVDTGMGFERLTMVMQGKQKSYDTDIFMPFIQFIEQETGVKYGGGYATTDYSDIAFRVIADHLRAVAFAIADGELPSNTGAGYVLRRILRRAVRYYYSYLNRSHPLMYQMVGLLGEKFKQVFPELFAQQEFVTKVILEEEKSFLRTLEGGLKRIEQLNIRGGEISGAAAFELYDTYGFPIDLIRLIGQEKGFGVDVDGFGKELEKQKARSRADAKVVTGDWFTIDHSNMNLSGGGTMQDFKGYDEWKVGGVFIVKYRTIQEKNQPVYQIVLDQTPFYPEGGGQQGDTGILRCMEGKELCIILDTYKENDLIIHQVDKLPVQVQHAWVAEIDLPRRKQIENNHSATHLLHAALRKVLGAHVQQKGSLVAPDYLRFDISHFQKMTQEEIQQVEDLVNAQIRRDIPLQEDRSISLAQAKEKGAMMLFGEKYGETVRMITFDDQYSRELCGGCHVPRTGHIGSFKITSEAAVAAGVRRIEAITAGAVDKYVRNLEEEMQQIRVLMKSPKDMVKSVQAYIDENKQIRKQLEQMQLQQAMNFKQSIVDAIQQHPQRIYVGRIPVQDPQFIKELAYQIEREHGPVALVLGAVQQDKPSLTVIISEALTAKHQWHAGQIVKACAPLMEGGGGGQPFFATAGGKNPGGLAAALDKAKQLLS